MIDVERVVEVVGLNPQHVGSAHALVQGNAVDHRPRIAAVEQLILIQACRASPRRIGQTREELSDRILRILIERGSDGQVKTV